MQRKCPYCGGVEVRRSGSPDLDESARTLLRSRYHCRSGRGLFWVISARTYQTNGFLLGLGLLVFVIVAFLLPTGTE